MEPCEIAIDRWPNWLERFSLAHAGEPTRISTSGAAPGGGGGALTAEDLPLIGVSRGGADEIRVMVGRPGGPHVDHVVAHPRRLWIAEWNDGFSGMLEIDADDGSTTLVQVGPPEQVLPEGMVVDGVPPPV